MCTQSAVQFLTVPSDPANTEQLQLAYKWYTPTDSAATKRRPVILVRGWQGVKEDWAFVAEGVAQQRPVLVYDNRSIGESTIPKQQYTINEFVNDMYLMVTNVIQKQYPQHSKIHVFGQSMGGAIVQNFLLKYSQLVQSAVIGCSLVNGTTAPKSQKFLDFISKPPPKTPDELKQYQYKFMEFLLTPEFVADETNKPFVENMAKNRVAYKRDSHGSQQQSIALGGHDTESRLHEIDTTKLPVLIQHGTEDSLLLFSNGEALHKGIKGSVMSTWEGAGHMYWAHGWKDGLDNKLPREMRDWYAKYDNDQNTSAL